MIDIHHTELERFCVGPVLLKLQYAHELSGVLVTHYDLVGLSWAWESVLSNTFPRDADCTGLGTTLKVLTTEPREKETA